MNGKVEQYVIQKLLNLYKYLLLLYDYVLLMLAFIFVVSWINFKGLAKHFITA